MKHKALVFYSLSAILIGVLVLFRAPERVGTSGTTSKDQLLSPDRISTQSIPASRQSDGKHGTASANETEDQYAKWFFEELARDSALEWKQPINFWGIVVDENRNPVQGAQVRFTWNDLSAKGTSNEETTSDTAGRFSLLKRTGKGLTVDVDKPGYYPFANSSRKDFEYAVPSTRFHPDPDHPVVFQFKKFGVSEPLIVGLRFNDFPSNLTTRSLELIEGKWVPPEQGDLVISFIRDPVRILGKANWEVTLRVRNGGLQEYSDRLEFQAPESGYQSELTYRFDVADPDYVGQLKKLYFLKLRDGAAYGRIEVTLIGMWNDSSAVDMKSWVNPRGSRNLEFDPKLQPLPPRWP